MGFMRSGRILKELQRGVAFGSVIIGSILFEKEDVSAVSVNEEKYWNILPFGNRGFRCNVVPSRLCHMLYSWRNNDFTAGRFLKTVGV